MTSPPRWAWVTSGVIVGLVLFVTEFILVLGLTMGVFYSIGLKGWLAPAATVVFAVSLMWILALLLTFIASCVKYVRDSGWHDGATPTSGR